MISQFPCGDAGEHEPHAELPGEPYHGPCTQRWEESRNRLSIGKQALLPIGRVRTFRFGELAEDITQPWIALDPCKGVIERGAVALVFPIAQDPRQVTLFHEGLPVLNWKNPVWAVGTAHNRDQTTDTARGLISVSTLIADSSGEAWESAITVGVSPWSFRVFRNSLRGKRA